MHDMMIDLETLGTAPGSVILSIGAVLFDPFGDIDEDLDRDKHVFYTNLSRSDQEAHGGTVDQDTINWWKKQGDEARDMLGKDTIGFYDANRQLRNFSPSNVRPWANAPSFDCVLWEAMCRRYSVAPPWRYYNQMCVRTPLRMAGIDKNDYPFTGVKHYAVDDCISQIRWVQAAYRRLQCERS